ncbi:MAG TPA: flippase-like domain-containing protein [Candidatus Binatia bacterium]|nr:flippase-like domain-containing protein [Candidatus Binatia bacterium]
MSAGGDVRRRIVPLLALAAGLSLLGWLLHHTGFEPVWQRLRVLGWAAPLVFVPYLLIAIIDARGWRLALPAAARARIPLPGLMLTRMAGEAVNSLTPVAALGEPVKVYLLRPWQVTGSEALASVVISKTALIASQSLFTALGIAALLARIGRPQLALGWLVVLVVICALFTTGLVWVQHRSPGAALWRLLRRVVPRARLVDRLETSIAAFDHRLRDFYRGEPRAFLRASTWHFTGWLLGVVEVVVMVTLMGRSVTWLDAFVIETLAQPIRATSILVPAGIGTQELGGVWLCTFLGMAEADAVTLWLLKRAREVVFDGVGVAYFAQHGGRRAFKAE